ncbi:hypothetical protein QBC46DRAFT_116096 [Diplogelasinospora grovesii]|uniref:Signal peptide-containing protein n=1 Tax=Diplogelasinospora grovesii TaxID=303347 RepID=A0AAN6S9U5_9PEZI|nr:hypothetical protein QBC46DRAFT_116096 [Diplogelasinospora grovesii]
MSFCVAVQSAIFYYVACTPCAKVRHRYKAREQAKKEREEKARVVAEQPHLYCHPDPFHTNPYWTEEIMMGPSLPKKGKGGDGSKNHSQRHLTSAGGSSSAGGSNGTASSLAISGSAGTAPGTSHNDKPATADGQIATGTTPRTGASSPTVAAPEDDVLSKTLSVSTGDDWNRKRYQREDEELWGHEFEFARTGHKLMDAIKQAGTTAGRFVESKLGIDKPVTEEDRHNFYFSPRNPPVNDYHPPVVSSRPLHKDAHHWMLQPPPPAKVMEGKVPVSRSGSVMSKSSRRTVGTVGTSDGHYGLGRQIGERSLEARGIRKGSFTPNDDGAAAELHLHSTNSLNRPRSSNRRPTTSTARTRSQRTTRSRSVTDTTDSDDADTEAEGGRGRRSRQRRIHHRPPVTPEVESEEEKDSHDEDEGEYVTKSSSQTLPNNSGGSGNTNVAATHAAQKPRLSIILSSETTENNASSSTFTPRVADKSSSSVTPLGEVTNNLSPVSSSASAPPKPRTAAGSTTDSGLALAV